MAGEDRRGAVARFALPLGSVRTDVVIGRALLRSVPELFADYRGGRLILIADTTVGPLYAEPLCSLLAQAGYDARILLFPAGEDSKSMDTVVRLCADCCALGVDRDDTVVAMGGGVVGDVAGMVAGMYMRGINFIQIPTSLVGMVTAAVGGKVGVNLGHHKNMIGLFKHPLLVVVDVDTLATLPTDEVRSGLGELITVGVLGAPAIFTVIESDGPRDLQELIEAALRCKGRFVVADPEDRHGIRAQLNLGHTFGHALEKLSGFQVPHGFAVAIGLHLACRLAAGMGILPVATADRVHRVLIALDLPVTVPAYGAERIVEAMRGDKKRRQGRLRLVLPRALGEVIVVDENDVPTGLLLETLTAWGAEIRPGRPPGRSGQ
jgi:3-dehydroquinate synthase